MKRFLSCFWILLSYLCCLADCSEKSLAYDQNGNISKYTASHAGEVSYAYDPIQRPTNIDYPDGKFIKYAYDYNSNLTEVSDGHGITSYSYDALNQLIKAQFPSGDIAYEYDPASRLIKIIYPDLEEVQYHYDHRGRLVQVLDQAGHAQYEYDDETNLVTKELLSNGVITEYFYDHAPQVTGVVHKKSDGTLIVEYRYSYDKNGNCTSVEKTTPSQVETAIYVYDKLSRLIEARYSDQSFEKYTYDGAGNRLTKSTQDETIEYEYDYLNRLTRAGEIFFDYDSSGNLSKKRCRGKETLFHYDATGKLISWDDGENRILFDYDGEGRRVSKTVNGKKTFFVNDPAAPLSRVLLEKDEDGTTLKRYVYGHSRLFSNQSSGLQFFLYDHPGKSVSCLVDRKQQILESFRYDAFGCRNVKSVLENPYGYIGEEYDEEIGLFYLRNRYYDPEIGRFISPDSVLGVLNDPQTLNPYVYVRNNSINFIDPSGLYAVKVPLTFYGNYPRTQTPAGKSRVGHGWIGGIDATGGEFNQGAWPGEPRDVMHVNENTASFCHDTVSLTVWVTPEQQMLARQAGNYPHWTPYDNCIDHVVQSMDAIGYPHPSFKKMVTGISSPTKFCNWMIGENNHIDSNFFLSQGDVIPYEINSKGLQADYSFLFQPNYGGASLSKLADLMTSLSDISGAIFDQATGQVILYGKKDLRLPSLHLDDLAVAVRSVYGLGTKGEQNPGISMDPDPNLSKKKKKPQNRMIVTYYGETKDTRFGQVMFEADRLLKNLTIGRDNYTGKKFTSNVSGYSNLLQLYQRERHFPGSNFSWRMWFVPEKISLVQSEDGRSMVFDEVRMQVLTESKFKSKSFSDSAAEKFASHFTYHYDSYAQEFPVLQDLKRLGKITGIVKWIKEQNLPFDLSFFKSYSPQFVSTPDYTSQMGDTVGQLTITGGVLYHLDDQNFFTTTDWQMNATKDEVLLTRPNEQDLSWDFGSGFSAVAQNFGKVVKVGDVRKVFTDMIFPALGVAPLGLVRTYDSFNDQRSGFGLGWDVTPAKLRFPNIKQFIRFSDSSILKVHAEIFVSFEGVEVHYKIAGLDSLKRPLYRTDGKNTALIELSDEKFLWSRKQEEINFDSCGKLISIKDRDGSSIDYAYENEKLVSISQGKRAIHLEYQGDKIARAIGLGGKVIYYDYSPNGQLEAVKDSEGVIATYQYDEDHRLTAIFDAKNHLIFEASYDIYNRAEERIVDGSQFYQNFSLLDRRAKIEGTNGFFLEEVFDEKYRPQSITDALGRRLDFIYAGPFGPECVSDQNGMEVFYEYDAFGNPIKITDAFRGKRSFVFDQHGHLLEEVDGRGTKMIYLYNQQGKIIKTYRPFFMNLLRVESGKVTIGGDERFATTFRYDEKGALASIDYPGGGTDGFCLDEAGLPLEIDYANGLVSKRTYDHRCRLKEIHEMGRAISYTYDKRDRIQSISSPLGTVEYSYDANGNILSKTDPMGNVSRFAYDEKNHLVQVIDALGGRSSYEYSSSGDLVKMTLPNESTRVIQYDEFERPVVLR
ncbi:MAG: RHS repeat-associated core domain-containing protein [Simkaniaceae bacterium]